MEEVASLVDGQKLKVPMIVCTSPQTYGDAGRMGFVDKIENAGGTVVLEGTCFYQQGCKRNRRSKRLGSPC
jgi:predicted aconitase